MTDRDEGRPHEQDHDSSPPTNDVEKEARLQSLLEFFELQIDQIKKMPLDEVITELRRLGSDEKRLIRRIRGRVERVSSEAVETSSSATARKPRRTLRRRTTAALALLLLAYGLLWTASHLSASETDRLATLVPLKDQLKGFHRNAGNHSEADARIDSAISLLLSSQRTTMGLFPQYDSAAVDEAILTLESVVEPEMDTLPSAVTVPEPPRHNLAIFLLAKAYLMRGDVSKARNHLKTIAGAPDGEYREQAAALLARLPVHGGG